jgi:hypothetical protein
MSTKHNTKEEAEKEVERLGNEVLDIFCPLHDIGNCSPRCPCYQFASFNEQPIYEKGKPNVFWVHPACCNNAMFFNTCQAGNY